MFDKPKQYTDEALVGMICSGSITERDKALHFIFNKSGWRQSALSIVRRKNTEEIAKEAVHQALIVLDRDIRDGSFDKTKSIKNYFIGICKGRAFSIVRSTWRVDNDDKIPEKPTNETPETLALKEERAVIIRRLLTELKDPCPEALTLYMLSFSIREIDVKLNINNEDATKKMIFDCRKKLAKLIDNSPTLKRFFDRKELKK
jgi:DNA-directed RNA polymerase specialized sigma24 family protein